jgi:hypothetical protein
MAWFGRRRQQERDNVNDMERAIAVISARLRFLEALTPYLLAELPPERRDGLLEQVRKAVGGLKVLPPPTHVPPGREQEFYNELSRAMIVSLTECSDAHAPLGTQAPDQGGS